MCSEDASMKAVKVLREAAQRLRARGEAKLAAQVSLAARAVELLPADAWDSPTLAELWFAVTMVKALAHGRRPSGVSLHLTTVLNLVRRVQDEELPG